MIRLVSLDTWRIFTAQHGDEICGVSGSTVRTNVVIGTSVLISNFFDFLWIISCIPILHRRPTFLSCCDALFCSGYKHSVCDRERHICRVDVQISDIYSQRSRETSQICSFFYFYKMAAIVELLGWHWANTVMQLHHHHHHSKILISIVACECVCLRALRQDAGEDKQNRKSVVSEIFREFHSRLSSSQCTVLSQRYAPWCLHSWLNLWDLFFLW